MNSDTGGFRKIFMNFWEPIKFHKNKEISEHPHGDKNKY